MTSRIDGHAGWQRAEWIAEWAKMPRGIVAQFMSHTSNATAEKHYINRPLEFLAVWHGKYEAWILEQAGVEFHPNTQNLRAVAA